MRSLRCPRKEQQLKTAVDYGKLSLSVHAVKTVFTLCFYVGILSLLRNNLQYLSDLSCPIRPVKMMFPDHHSKAVCIINESNRGE